MLTVPESVFGTAFQAPVVIDEGVTNVMIDGQAVTDMVEFPVVNAESAYSFSFTRGGTTTQSTLYFTYLPILVLTGTFGNDYVEAPLQMIMPDEDGAMDYRVRVKWAGSSTNGTWTHKRSYHFKFVDDEGEKMNVSFFGLRDDNHWRLDAGTVDMIRFRNKAAHALWADFNSKPYYADKQPKARSYARGSHVEMFLNGEYRGFFDLTEYLDRKQMKLKKYDEPDDDDDDDDDDDNDGTVTMHGLLWKGKSETTQTLFMGVTAMDNTKDNWGGFDLVYPDLEDVNPTDYSVLYNAVNFVGSTNDETFLAQVGDYFDLPVLADYYVFINTIFAIDNTCKNIIWGCYDCQVDKKLTLAVWDLDATAGQHWRDQEGYYHADAIQPENDLDQLPTNTCKLSLNKLFTRLKSLPYYNIRAVNRYWELRKNVLDPDSLVARYSAIYERLQNCGALARETVRWSDTGDIAHRMLTFDEEYEYLCDWLRRRIAYMDTHTFACLRGDVNGDGNINISDVTDLIAYVLNSGAVDKEINLANADVNANDEINISDVVELISIVLNQP